MPSELGVVHQCGLSDLQREVGGVKGGIFEGGANVADDVVVSQLAHGKVHADRERRS